MFQEPESLTPLQPEVFASLPQEVKVYIQSLEKQVVWLMAQVQGLVTKVQQLEARLAKDSSNSSKPPSSDGLGKKPKTSSLRGKSGRKPGGQPGHTGRTLERVSNPDHVEIHSPKACEHCQNNLSEIVAVNVEARQVFDLPEVVVEVTEHRAETKLCPCCGHRSKGQFPDNVKAPTQYGERVRALAAYFEHQHLIPFERVSQIFEDIYGISLSPGSCHNADKRLFQNLEIFETNLKTYLLVCKVLHFDETGIRCEKKLHWVHVTSSATATFYGIHNKRGQEALNDFNILPRFGGIAIHDHWFPYFAYKQVQHGLCNAHHLRELKYVYEQEKGEWAQKMTMILLKANKIADQARNQGQQKILPEDIQLIYQEYSQIILEGAAYYQGVSELVKEESEQFIELPKKAGFNLFRRLLHKMDIVLAFTRDLEVPFTNNQAEQDLRMLKVKQKISGCFRSFEGGVISCRIRSYISTARKQGWGILDALIDAIQGSPRLLSIPASF
jgi:transposase